MKRGNYTAGAMFASLAAGPAFLASIALATWANATPSTYSFAGNGDGIGGGLIAALFVIPFGFVLSVVPNLIGTWFMHGIGIGNFALRFPVAWAVAGAGAAGLPFVFIPDLVSQFVPFGTAFPLTGASCALVAHRFTRWS